MWENYYLLDLGSLQGTQPEPADRRAVKEKMEALLDQERLLKYEKRKNTDAALQSLGSGVLLQLAAREYLCQKESRKESEEKKRVGEESGGRQIPLRRLTPGAVLEQMPQGEKGQSFDVRYRYGAQGKPFFADLSLYFSLSHSGRAVFLAVSQEEIGADIQNVRRADWRALAKRFYGKRDLCELENCGDTEQAKKLFYRLWAQKEAYGKLTGEGVAGVLNREIPGPEEGLLWDLETLTLGGEDYFLAVCRNRSGQKKMKDSEEFAQYSCGYGDWREERKKYQRMER